MNVEIVDVPIWFDLYGMAGTVDDEQYAIVGMSLMNEMWQMIKSARIQTAGINHWVYLPKGRMFTGVELRGNQTPAVSNGLERLTFELSRYARHVHVGPYQGLPRKWKDLQAELVARGEIIGTPSLEVYGHHCVEPSALETTILICLKAKPA